MAEDKSGIQVIARAAAVLRSLEDKPDGLSLGEIARDLDLAKSTVQRIVKALCDEQLLIAASSTARVKIGPAIVRMAAAFKSDIGQQALPFMRELSRGIGETVDLSVQQGNRSVFIEQVLGTERLAAVSHVGDSFPLHNTANGKALLACLTPARRLRLLSDRSQILEPQRLERELSQFLEEGLTFDREEHTAGISAIGTAFLDAFGQAYALSIPVPTPRFSVKLPKLKEALLAARAGLVEKAQGSLP